MELKHSLFWFWSVGIETTLRANIVYMILVKATIYLFNPGGAMNRIIVNMKAHIEKNWKQYS